MSANTNPLFPIIPNTGHGQLISGNALLTSIGQGITAFTAGVNGSRMEYIHAHATVVNTAGMLRFYIWDGVSSNALLWHEVPTSATTPSGSVAAAEVEFIPTRPLVMSSGYAMFATTNNVGETWNVFCHGGDF